MDNKIDKQTRNTTDGTTNEKTYKQTDGQTDRQTENRTEHRRRHTRNQARYLPQLLTNPGGSHDPRSAGGAWWMRARALDRHKVIDKRCHS